MGGGRPSVIELLDRDWAILAESAPATAALARWRCEDEALARFGSLDQLLAYVQRRTVDVVARDQVLGALGTRASVDPIAARTLMQLLLPGAKAIVARYLWSAESIEELAAAVVADLYDRIQALPAAAPRRCLAPSVLLEVGKRAQRRAARARHLAAARLDDVDADGTATYEHGVAAIELADLLRWATTEGHVSGADAELIRLTRVADVPVAQLSVNSGESPQTIRQRRLRAERALAAAVRVA